MPVIDTSLLIERVSEGKPIAEDVCFITVIEFPTLLEYRKFTGEILYPALQDMELALELQQRLKDIGRMKGSSDLIIAALCINSDEALLTLDSDFKEISRASSLKVIYE